MASCAEGLGLSELIGDELFRWIVVPALLVQSFKELVMNKTWRDQYYCQYCTYYHQLTTNLIPHTIRDNWYSSWYSYGLIALANARAYWPYSHQLEYLIVYILENVRYIINSVSSDGPDTPTYTSM